MHGALSKRELSFALDAVYRINTTEDIPSYARISLSLICTAIPCDQGIFTLIDDVDGIPQSSSTYTWGQEALFMDKFKAGGYERDKMLGAMNLKANSYAMRDSDVMDEQERMNTRLYQDIYKPQGMHYVMRITLIWRDKMIGQYTLLKTKESLDFTDNDLETGSLFAPHLALKLDQLKNSAPDSTRGGMLMSRYGLTARELEVVLMVADGISDEAISEKLFISNSTVKKHLYNAYAKIGVSNKLQLKMALGGQ